MANIYYIGGSPCSGKSTIAEMITKEFDLYYFKVDDYLDKYLSEGIMKGKQICSKLGKMSSEEIWMRDPEEQKEEELLYYKEVFEFIVQDLSELHDTKGIITEGAAYLPELMQAGGIDHNHYINITPTKEFQIFHYKERPWVSKVLEGCSDKVKAFEHWMNRDALFANYVRNQSIELGYKAILIDGSKSTEEIFKEVTHAMCLEG